MSDEDTLRGSSSASILFDRTELEEHSSDPVASSAHELQAPDNVIPNLSEGASASPVTVSFDSGEPCHIASPRPGISFSFLPSPERIETMRMRLYPVNSGDNGQPQFVSRIPIRSGTARPTRTLAPGHSQNPQKQDSGSFRPGPRVRDGDYLPTHQPLDQRTLMHRYNILRQLEGLASYPVPAHIEQGFDDTMPELLQQISVPAQPSSELPEYTRPLRRQTAVVIPRTRSKKAPGAVSAASTIRPVNSAASSFRLGDDSAAPNSRPVGSAASNSRLADSAVPVSQPAGTPVLSVSLELSD